MTEEEFRKQDRTWPENGLNMDDLRALKAFVTKYPTWWWKLGWCNVSRDFDAAPQGHSPEARYITAGNVWDNGFSSDNETFSDAIYDVMEQIELTIPTTA